jgi:hypothetical protein
MSDAMLNYVICWDVTPLNLVELHRCIVSTFRANVCKAGTSSYSPAKVDSDRRWRNAIFALDHCSFHYMTCTSSVAAISWNKRDLHLKAVPRFVLPDMPLNAAGDVRAGFPFVILTSQTPLSHHDEPWTWFPRKLYRWHWEHGSRFAVPWGCVRMLSTVTTSHPSMVGSRDGVAIGSHPEGAQFESQSIFSSFLWPLGTDA